MDLPLARHPAVRTSSLEEARELFGSLATPVTLEMSERRASFAWTGNVVSLGPLVIGASQYGGAYVASSAADDDVFSLSLPIGDVGAEASAGSGVFPVVRDRSTFIASAGRSFRFAMGSGYRAVDLVIGRAEVNAAMRALTGRPDIAPTVFDPALALDAGAGATLQRLVGFALAELEHEGSALRSPIVAARFADTIVHTLLLGHNHNHAARVDGRIEPPEPRHVRAAAAYLEAHAAEPITIGALAAHVGISTRSLQVGFQKHRGCSPMEFLRERRLDLARERLVRSPNASITRIASDCGFGHLGRFSEMYRRRFGESPAMTRRRAR